VILLPARHTHSYSDGMPSRGRPLGWASLPLLFAGLLAGWTWLSFQQNGGDWHETDGMLAAGALAYIAGLVLSGQRAVVGPLLAVGIGITFLFSDGAFSGHPLAPPLGYENANAALLVQAAAAAGLAVATTEEWGNVVALTGVAGIGVILLALGSQAGVATLAMVAVAVAVAAGGLAPKKPHLVPWLLLIAVPPVVTYLVVTRPWLPGLDEVSRLVTQRRVDLWHDAMTLAQQHPWNGWGPGQFSVESVTAASDQDTRAAHSALLEVAAELGFVGLALAVAVLATGIVVVRLGAYDEPGAALVGATAWVAVWAHAAVDYIADFPAVLIVSAFVLGLSTHAGRERTSRPRKLTYQSPALRDGW
jgi:O-antigen ligase